MIFFVASSTISSVESAETTSANAESELAAVDASVMEVEDPLDAASDAATSEAAAALSTADDEESIGEFIVDGIKPEVFKAADKGSSPSPAPDVEEFSSGARKSCISAEAELERPGDFKECICC